MSCEEFGLWAERPQSDETDASALSAYRRHQEQCAECACLLESTRTFDEMLRKEILAETPDPAAVIGRVRTRMPRDNGNVRRWLPIAAAALLALGAAATWRASRPTENRLISAAIRDHNLEVKANSPRRWRLSIPAMQPLLEQYRVGWSDVQALLPVGFILEKAKECRIDGQPTLHLVFGDGSRSVSVFFRAGEDMPILQQTTLEGADAAGFHRGKLAGIVVAAGAPGLCAEAVRRLSAL